jgi:alpha-ribazole phosphatase
MTQLVLIRHGETEWNVEGRWQGQADVPLNARGQQQAQELAQELADTGISAIYSSDLQRAYATAQALAQKTGLEIHTDERLREIHQGDWQGMLVTEIQERYASRFEDRRKNPLTVAPPGGESVAEVKERVIAAVEDILERHPNHRVAIVSHGFALAVIQVHYLGMPMEHVWDMIPANDEWRELIVDAPRKGLMPPS